MDDNGGNRLSSQMPRGNPKKKMILRIDPALAAEVKLHLGDGYFTTAIEEGLRLWLARERRRAAKPGLLAKRLAPPTGREIAARSGD
jgi:hypothetical protein